MSSRPPVPEPSTRPSLREEHRRITRERVLAGAVAVFGEKSLVDATMEDVARAAGVTRATVYAYFPGKGEILQALLARVYDLADEVYGDLAALPEWTREGVRAWLEGAVARWRPMAPVIRVLTAAGGTALGDADRARARSLAAHEHYVGLLTGASRRWRDATPAEARQRALMAVLQVESYLTIWLAGGWPAAGADPVGLLADAVCHLLAPAMDDPDA